MSQNIDIIDKACCLPGFGSPWEYQNTELEWLTKHYTVKVWMWSDWGRWPYSHNTYIQECKRCDRFQLVLRSYHCMSVSDSGEMSAPDSGVYPLSASVFFVKFVHNVYNPTLVHDMGVFIICQLPVDSVSSHYSEPLRHWH